MVEPAPVCSGGNLNWQARADGNGRLAAGRLGVRGGRAARVGGGWGGGGGWGKESEGRGWREGSAGGW